MVRRRLCRRGTFFENRKRVLPFAHELRFCFGLEAATKSKPLFKTNCQRIWASEGLAFSTIPHLLERSV